MTPQPIKGFVPRTTHHCITGSVQHVYHFHDYPLSEDMLLGLGAGLGFIYWHMKGVPPIFGGRANFERPGQKGLEKIIGERTGVQVESHYTTSKRKAERALLEMLDAGEPVMVYVDMGFLPYFDLPEDFHFGGHAIVVAGHEDGQAVVADRDGVPHAVSLETLAQARGSTYKPFPPRNAWYTFDFAGKRPPQPQEARQAIREVTEGMLQPPIANIGVKGIRTAARRVKKWPTKMSEADLIEACWSVHMYIAADGGTGGGIFRYMYGRFLQEAAEVMGEPRLAELGEELKIVGDKWEVVAGQLFTEAAAMPSPSEGLGDICSHLLSIADCEQAVWEKLQRLLD